jgi:SAM-dependent methyltransferase
VRRTDALALHSDPRELPQLLAAQAADLLRRRLRLPAGVAAHPAGCADLILTTDATTNDRGDRNQLLSACATVLRPGGYLAATTSNAPGTGREPGAETVARCAQLGLCYWQHIVCLLVPIDNGQLAPVHAPHGARAVATVVHRDVHVFRKPPATDARPSTQTRRAA